MRRCCWWLRDGLAVWCWSLAISDLAAVVFTEKIEIHRNTQTISALCMIAVCCSAREIKMAVQGCGCRCTLRTLCTCYTLWFTWRWLLSRRLCLLVMLCFLQVWNAGAASSAQNEVAWPAVTSSNSIYKLLRLRERLMRCYKCFKTSSGPI